MRAFGEMVAAGKEYLVGEGLTIANVAVVCAVTWVEWAEGWKEREPVLAGWVGGLDERKEFRETRAVMFDLRKRVV